MEFQYESPYLDQGFYWRPRLTDCESRTNHILLVQADSLGFFLDRRTPSGQINQMDCSAWLKSQAEENQKLSILYVQLDIIATISIISKTS